MDNYYNRYTKFITEGQVAKRLPFLEIPVSMSDLYIQYSKKTMRMDMLSYKYYGDCQYGWLILQANPEYGGFEFSIPDGVPYRIPYPLDSAISRYESAANKWINEHDGVWDA